jgi:hypothetical protein
MTLFMVLFLMIAAHAALDYALQGDTVAINKNPNANTPLQKHVPWYYWLASHALVHGGAVALITGSAGLGVAETAAHFAIDYGKCSGKYSIHIDQLLHMVCKLVWLLVWFFLIKV